MQVGGRTDVTINFVDFQPGPTSGTRKEFWCPIHVDQEYIEVHLSAVDVESDVECHDEGIGAGRRARSSFSFVAAKISGSQIGCLAVIRLVRD